MAGNSRGARGGVFRNQGTIDAQLWKSLQGALFLEPTHSLSRVEAYPADLLVPAREVVTSAAEIANPGITEIDPAVASPTTTAPDEDVDDDEFEITRFVALRTPEDITDYVGGTRKFRAFFIRQRYSWGPLLITSRLFADLIVRARISPRLKSFVMYFGGREREVEISPPALRFVRLSSDEEASQRGHECIYGLRFMERNGRSDTEKPSREWSLRQSAIFCRYAPDEDGASWLFITISQRMQQRLNSIVADSGSFHDSDPFEVHILLIDSAISSWRQYLVDLSAETDAQYAQLLGTSPSDEGPIDLHESNRRQELLKLDEKLLNALLATSATADTLSALMSAWESTAEFSLTPAASYTELIRTSFEDQKRDLRLITSQIEHLRSKLAGVTNLLSSFLDLSSGFSLQNLVKESGKENEEMRKLSERMHRLAEKSTQDAAAVKVLTILALVYLPITVVSNFFSTAFVNTTTSPDGSGRIIVYGDWWILPAVSIPLTLITLYVWLVWTGIQANPSNQPWWWYVVGIRLFNRQSKPAAHVNTAEKRRNDANGILAYGGEVNGEDPARVLQRTSSELC
jgi:Mg2+ and Co2+ transporter CorA